MNPTRIFYVCDVHGSEECWIKFLNAANMYKVDVLILNGDLTGKGIVPIVQCDDGSYTCSFLDRNYKLRNEREVEKMRRTIARSSYYSHVFTPREVKEFAENERGLYQIFEELMVERLRRWLGMIEGRVKPHVKLVMGPGNDDHFCVDSVLRDCDRIIYPLGEIVHLDDIHPMISYEYTNPTPWQTPREKNEEEIEEDMKKLFAMVDSYEHLVCMFHCPPYDSGLDIAPKLDEQLRLTGDVFGVVTVPVGSKAIRRAIEEYQPKIGLHAHIHESAGMRRIGRTICVNPGSEYTEGVLRGYVMDLFPEGIKRYFPVRG